MWMTLLVLHATGSHQGMSATSKRELVARSVIMAVNNSFGGIFVCLFGFSVSGMLLQHAHMGVVCFGG